MDNVELKDALLSGKPIILTHTDGHDGEYKRVSAIVYRAHNKRIIVSAELLDLNGHSVIICDPKNIRLKE